jgi:hypothetical protein
MSSFLIAVTGMIYAYVALDQHLNHDNPAMVMVYIGYAFANIGLYQLAK